MSQELTYEVAKTLKKGDILYHNIIAFTDENGITDSATATVLGRVKKVEGVEEFHLPLHQNYGAEIDTHATKFSKTLWRTVSEKFVPTPPARIARYRSVVSEAAHLPDVGVTAKRVKRSRG